jgi:hypothetical protein
MACSWTCEEISKPLPSGWTANLDGQTCYQFRRAFFMISLASAKGKSWTDAIS